MLTVHSLCWLCQMPLAISRWGVCSRCARTLFNTQPRCPQCGLPAAGHVVCGRCLRKAPPWSRLIAVNDYLPPLSHLIHEFKFCDKPELAPILARLMLLKARQTPEFPGQTGSSACRFGSGVTGDGDLIRAICCVSRWRNGSAAPGIPTRLNACEKPPPSTSSAQGYAPTT